MTLPSLPRIRPEWTAKCRVRLSFDGANTVLSLLHEENGDLALTLTVEGDAIRGHLTEHLCGWSVTAVFEHNQLTSPTLHFPSQGDARQFAEQSHGAWRLNSHRVEPAAICRYRLWQDGSSIEPPTAQAHLTDLDDLLHLAVYWALTYGQATS